MGKIWRISKPAVFAEVRTNMFIITLAIETNKFKVMQGKLWLSDGNLFALKDLDRQSQLAKVKFEVESFWVQLHDLPVIYMDKFYGNLIGNKIGKVLEVDVDEDDTGWGKYLRVRIEISLTKPLARVRSLQVKGESLRIPLQYKKLP